MDQRIRLPDLDVTSAAVLLAMADNGGSWRRALAALGCGDVPEVRLQFVMRGWVDLPEDEEVDDMTLTAAGRAAAEQARAISRMPGNSVAH